MKKFEGDELMSDSLPYTILDEIIYEVEGKLQIKGVDDDPLSSLDVEGDKDISPEQFINIVQAHQLRIPDLNKKRYMKHIKLYLKKVKKHLEATQPDRLDIFSKNSHLFVKKVLSNMEKYTFYVGESDEDDHNIQGQVILSFFSEDSITPHFYIWKDGLKEERYGKKPLSTVL